MKTAHNQFHTVTWVTSLLRYS